MNSLRSSTADDTFSDGQLLRTPGSPIFLDRPHAATPVTDIPHQRPPAAAVAAGPMEVTLSDGEYVYMMTGQRGSVHLYDTVSMRSPERSTTSVGDNATSTQTESGSETSDTKVVLEMVRRVWIAGEGDIEKDRGEREEIAACPICLEPMESGKAVVTSCSHCFHIGCCRHSERVSIGSTGFWSCPSCREVISIIRVRIVKGDQVMTEMDTAPSPDTTLNLTCILKRNSRMQGVVRNLLLLEDFVVGVRDSGIGKFETHVQPDLKEDDRSLRSAATLSHERGENEHEAILDNHKAGCTAAAENDEEAGVVTEYDANVFATDDEAGAFNGYAADYAIGNENGVKEVKALPVVIVVPTGAGGAELSEKPARAGALDKGRPGVLSATVEMKFLRLGDRGIGQDGRDIGVDGLLAQATWRQAQRTRRYYFLGFLAVCSSRTRRSHTPHMPNSRSSSAFCLLTCALRRSPRCCMLCIHTTAPSHPFTNLLLCILTCEHLFVIILPSPAL